MTGSRCKRAEPGADLRINGFGRTIQIDFDGPSIRMEFDGERSYPNPAPVRFTEVIDGDVGSSFGGGCRRRTHCEPDARPSFCDADAGF